MIDRVDLIRYVMEENGAVFSSGQTFRYVLWRALNPKPVRRTVTFVMLNPSTADANTDDPTIRRCTHFAKAHDFDRLVVVNLFAFCATNPDALYVHVSDKTALLSPIGTFNDEWIDQAASNTDVIVCAWGALRPDAMRRARSVLQRLDVRKLKHLGLTKDGHPKHPLYLSNDTRLQPW